MAKALQSRKNSHSWLKTLWEIGVLLGTGAKPWVHHLLEGLNGRLAHYARLLEKRLFGLALRGFAFFTSVLLIGIGALFMAIDYGGVPRGVACLGAGFFGLTVLVFWILLTNENRR